MRWLEGKRSGNILFCFKRIFISFISEYACCLKQYTASISITQFLDAITAITYLEIIRNVPFHHILQYNSVYTNLLDLLTISSRIGGNYLKLVNWLNKIDGKEIYLFLFMKHIYELLCAFSILYAWFGYHLPFYKNGTFMTSSH